MTSRLPEPRESDISIIVGTYTLEGLIWRKPCAYDQIVTQDEVDEGYFAFVEYDLERAPFCAPELVRVRAYQTVNEHMKGTPTPISAGLQEVFSQYLQDDAGRWKEAWAWLDEMGEPVRARRAA
jgi:hypothetical protein